MPDSSSALEVKVGKTKSGSAKNNGSFKSIWTDCIQPIFTLNFAGYKTKDTVKTPGNYKLNDANIKSLSKGKTGSDCGQMFDVFITSAVLAKFLINKAIEGKADEGDTLLILSAIRKFAVSVAGCIRCVTKTVKVIKGKKQEGGNPNKKGCLSDLVSLAMKFLVGCFDDMLKSSSLEVSQLNQNQKAEAEAEGALTDALSVLPSLNEECSPSAYYKDECVKKCEPECDC
jgi:hypothetical protein